MLLFGLGKFIGLCWLLVMYSLLKCGLSEGVFFSVLLLMLFGRCLGLF